MLGRSLFGGMLVMAVCAGSAEAGVLSPKLLSKLSPKGKGSQAKADCANFSGSWAGTCVDNEGFEYEDKLEIEQDESDQCNEINMGGFWISIGGSNTQGSVNPTYNNEFEYKIYSDWNPAHTELSYKLFGSSRVLNERSSGNFEGRGRMRMIGSQLEIFSEYSSNFENEGSTYKYQGWDECTYSKVEK